MTLTKSWHVLSYGLSDVGLVRYKNEDAWARDLSCHLYVLADGIGGRQAGEVASQRAVHRLCEVIAQNQALKGLNHPDSICGLLWDSIQLVNQEIYEMGEQNEFLKGMGTTLCALLVHENTVYTAHIGDSRIYLFRKGQLIRLTQDHKPPIAASHEYQHLISRALGVKENAQPTVSWHPSQPDDLFLLCSDGLSNSLSDEKIERILRYEMNLKELCQSLIEQSKSEGGSDNITALLVYLGIKHEPGSKTPPLNDAEKFTRVAHLLRQ